MSTDAASYPQLRNIRAVSCDVFGVLLATSGGAVHARAGVRSVLQTLQFLGYRLAAVVTHNAEARPVFKTPADAPTAAALLRAAQLDGFFEKIQTSAANPFNAVARALELAPTDILHVGSDLCADVNAALAAGMRAAWLAPTAAFHPSGGAVLLPSLDELPEMLRLADTAHLRVKPNSYATRNLLALLHGLPEEAPWNPSRRHEDPERGIGGLIEEVIAKLRTEAKPIQILRDRWPSIVGNPKFAAKSEPQTISKTGTLSVHCEDSVVRSELLNFYAKKMLAAIQQLSGCDTVKKLRFT